MDSAAGAAAPVTPAQRSASAEPDWTTALRKRGEESFQSIPTPVQKDKGWEFTDVSGLDLAAWPQPTEGNLDAQPARAQVVDSEGPGVLQVDGAVVRRGEAPDGIVVCTLDEAVAEHPELVEPHLGTLLTDRDKFTAQNTATWRGGLFVHVPAGVRAEQPVVATVLHDSASALHWRSLIVVEEDRKSVV